MRFCWIVIAAIFTCFSAPVMALDFAQCLGAQSSRALGFSGSGDLVVLTSEAGKRAVVFGDVTATFPPREEAPIVRYDAALPGVLALVDEGGNERYRLMLRDIDGESARQLSPPGARVAAPLVNAASGTVLFTSTAAQGRLWGILAHELRQAEPQIVFQEGGAWQPMAASADGSRVVIQQVFGLYDRVLYVHDVKTHIKIPLYLGQRPVAVRAAAISPGGETVYAAQALARQGGRILGVNVQSAAVRVLYVSSQWPIYELVLSADGTRLFALENRNGSSWLLAFDLPLNEEAAPIAVDLGGWAIGLAVDAKGEKVGLTLANTGAAARAMVLRADNGFALPLQTATQACGPVALKQVDIKREKPVGGNPLLPMQMIVPNQPAAMPMPVILAFHGGPEGQWLASSHLDYAALANTLGAAVVMPNLVGSTGYGLLYSAGDDGTRRSAVLDDVDLILSSVAQRPDLDERRIVAVGGSYGGYLAMLSLATYPGKIKAAISQVGISHIPSFLSETPITRRSLRRNEYGDERDDKIMKVLNALSPLTLAQQIKGPVLLLHGSNDARVLVGQSERMHARLKALGKTSRYVALPSTGHVVRRYETQLQVLEEKAAFLAEQFAVD